MKYWLCASPIISFTHPNIKIILCLDMEHFPPQWLPTLTLDSSPPDQHGNICTIIRVPASPSLNHSYNDSFLQATVEGLKNLVANFLDKHFKSQDIFSMNSAKNILKVYQSFQFTMHWQNRLGILAHTSLQDTCWRRSSHWGYPRDSGRMLILLHWWSNLNLTMTTRSCWPCVTDALQLILWWTTGRQDEAKYVSSFIFSMMIF